MERTKVVRGLRIAWSVGWGILSLLLIGLWLRSYQWADFVSGWITDNESVQFRSALGELALDCRAEKKMSSFWNTGKKSASKIAEARERAHVELGLTASPPQPVFAFSRNGGYLHVHIPHWFPVLLAGTIALLGVRPSRQFSLRTLLIATTLIAVVLGLVVWSFGG